MTGEINNDDSSVGNGAPDTLFVFWKATKAVSTSPIVSLAVLLYGFALIHIGLGHHERALDWLPHAYKVRDVHVIRVRPGMSSASQLK